MVHVYGTRTLVDETSLRQIVYDTTEKYESGMPQPWRTPLGENELKKQLKAIGFSIQVTRVESKFNSIRIDRAKIRTACCAHYRPRMIRRVVNWARS